MQDIKIKQKSVSKPVIPKKKLPKEFFEVGPERPEPKSPKRKSSKETMKLNKVLKHLDKMPDQSTDKLFEPYLKKSNTITSSPVISIHLEEMITLSQISSTGLTSTVRKVIHCTSLTLFSIKQIPISTREERKFLKEWTEKWQSLKNPNLVKIIETFWNVPEGCLSIVSEFQNAGSLADLIKVIGTIPEQPLRQIAKFLLDALKWMKENNEEFIVLSPSQILFDRTGNIKLSSGISKRLQKQVQENPLFQISQILIRAICDEPFEIKQKNCCFFHSIEPNPILQKLSSNLSHFLCGLSKFQETFNLEQALEHPWLRQDEYAGAAVELREIIGVEFKGEEYWEAGDLQLNRICEALKVVLMGRHFTRPRTEVVKTLAKELGVPDTVLGEKLNAVYKELKN